MSAPKPTEIVSYHEASHAVVADELGARVHWIERSADGSGHCEISEANDVKTSFDRAVIYAAGALGVGYKFGPAHAAINGNDLTGVRKLAPTDRTRAIERASDILRRRWPEVERHARQLIDDPEGFVATPFALGHS